jgi:hypothetical protein
VEQGTDFLVCRSLLVSFASNALICVDGALLSMSLRSDDVMSCKKGRMDGKTKMSGKMDGEVDGEIIGKMNRKEKRKEE